MVSLDLPMRTFIDSSQDQKGMMTEVIGSFGMNSNTLGQSLMTQTKICPCTLSESTQMHSLSSSRPVIYYTQCWHFHPPHPKSSKIQNGCNKITILKSFSLEKSARIGTIT